jgi:hypothetical protein
VGHRRDPEDIGAASREEVEESRLVEAFEAAIEDLDGMPLPADVGGNENEAQLVGVVPGERIRPGSNEKNAHAKPALSRERTTPRPAA